MSFQRQHLRTIINERFDFFSVNDKTAEQNCFIHKFHVKACDQYDEQTIVSTDPFKLQGLQGDFDTNSVKYSQDNNTKFILYTGKKLN